MADATAEADTQWMSRCLQEAEEAAKVGEVPVGAVVVYQGKLLAVARNNKETTNDPTGHAELIAIRAAAQELKAWRLTGCTLYVTLEPCAMCAGAIVLSRVDRVVFGCKDPKAGAVGSLMNLVQDARLNHRAEVTEGVLTEPASALLKRFFKARREGKQFGELAELVEGA